MCGIWALFGYGEDCRNGACLYEQFMKIQYRGPDQSRLETIGDFQNSYVGFHRLAIVGDERGMQPMRVKQYPHLILLYNGEIYNSQLLQEVFGFEYETDCDGECILHLYSKGGIEFAASQLDGTWALCLIDKRQRQVHLGRDTYGVRPCFRILTDQGCMAVCSEAKGVIGMFSEKNAETCRAVQPGSIETYTLHPNSSRVLNSSSKQFHSPERFPRYKTNVDIASLSDSIYENVRTLLTEAVKKRLMSDRRIGCLLSGGLDSSLIAGLLTKLLKANGAKYKLATFSIGLKGSPDIAAARKVAEYIQSEHHEVIFTPEEGTAVIQDTIKHLEIFDVFTVRSSLAMNLLSKYISEKTDNVVIFSGEGADEVAMGYVHFTHAPDAASAHDESMRLLRNLHLYDVCRSERCTAAHGLELRVPFLDHQFSAYYLSLPPELRSPQDRQEKYIIRKAFDGQGIIPDEVLWRSKECLSDGLASTEIPWFEIVQKHIEPLVSINELEQGHTVYKTTTPQTKEGYYYRKIFESVYPGQSSFTPQYWFHRWTSSDNSSRTLCNLKFSYPLYLHQASQSKFYINSLKNYSNN